MHREGETKKPSPAASRGTDYQKAGLVEEWGFKPRRASQPLCHKAHPCTRFFKCLPTSQGQTIQARSTKEQCTHTEQVSILN